jgi:archaeoflavoprotein AfpA
MNQKTNRVVWGITGCGDKLTETFNVMKELKETYEEKNEIDVYLSKAGVLVSKYYKLNNKLKDVFGRVLEEKNANTPFLTGQLQLGVFDFFLIAPCTSNTVAKLAHGIADTLLTNSALQALKAYIPVYVMPVDYHEGEIVTTLPNGKKLKLRVRKEDADNARKISEMDGVTTFEEPEEIKKIFIEKFGPP